MIVRAEDGQGGSNTIEVTINLDDEPEPPEDPAAPSVSAASSTSLTVTWAEPATTGPDISDYDIQYREGDSGAFTSWTHNSADRTATITGRTPDTRYEVKVLARNAEGTSDWSPSGTGSTSANEPPVFTDGSSATRSLDENTTGVQDIGDPVGATDPENTALTYSLEGTDADAFTIDTRSGQLHTARDETYDYETKRRYVLSVKATDGHGRDRSIPVFIDLTDLNEAPVFIGDGTFDSAENALSAGRVEAHDLDNADRITDYTITGGGDRSLFEIDSGGTLTFKNAPDFEDPGDNGRNNTYIVEVTAIGGTAGRILTAAQTITVTVTDENEPPGKPDPPTVSNETENSLTVTWTAPTNTGPDIANYHVQYRISGTFTDWSDTGPTLTRTITGLRSGTTYQIQVQAENDEGKGAWSDRVNGTTLTAPTVSSVAFTSTPASGQNNTYKLNDVIDVTATFSEAVTVTGTPQIDLTIGTTVRQADYKSGSTTAQLLFQYTVQATDEDTDGASINANGLKLNGGSIKNTALTVNANLVHNAQTNQSDHKVDGVAIVGVCSRTEQVRDQIVERVEGVSACGDVTEAHLATIDVLYLADRSISGLKAGDFSGLTALTGLSLNTNKLTSLPVGLFDPG